MFLVNDIVGLNILNLRYIRFGKDSDSGISFCKLGRTISFLKYIS